MSCTVACFSRGGT